MGGDPSSPTFKVPNLALAPELTDRIDDRVRLLKYFDQMRRDRDASGRMAAIDTYSRRAVDLLTSNTARDAFDLSKEDPRVRDQYGRHAYGQRALMARRLVEAGASFVTVVMENPSPGEDFPKGILYNWDSHAVNGHIFDDARFRLPRYDQAISAGGRSVRAAWTSGLCSSSPANSGARPGWNTTTDVPVATTGPTPCRCW